MTTKPLSRDEIARRVGKDIPDGAYVNLGIGLPTLAANYVPPDREVIYHSENGILGLGPSPKKGEEDLDIINAGKQNVTFPPAVGGAMDLGAGAASVWALMEHTTKDGQPKILEHCTYPLTAAGVVDRIYTNLAVIDVTPDGLMVREMAPGLKFNELQDKTGAKLQLANDWRVIQS